MAKATKIMLAGEGGQGVQSVAEILADAANNEGKEALYIPNFGVEQRGGVSIAFLQISTERIGAPKFNIGDIVVALSERAIIRTRHYVGENTVFVYDSGIKIDASELPQKTAKTIAIPALEVAQKELHPRVFNVIILGAIVEATKVVADKDAKNAIEKKLGYKFEQNPKLRELNYKAIDRGIEMVSQ